MRYLAVCFFFAACTPPGEPEEDPGQELEDGCDGIALYVVSAAGQHTEARDAAEAQGLACVESDPDDIWQCTSDPRWSTADTAECEAIADELDANSAIEGAGCGLACTG